MDFSKGNWKTRIEAERNCYVFMHMILFSCSILGNTCEINSDFL